MLRLDIAGADSGVEIEIVNRTTSFGARMVSATTEVRAHPQDSALLTSSNVCLPVHLCADFNFDRYGTSRTDGCA